MAIVNVPRDVDLQDAVMCAICQRCIPLAQATAGLQSADHQQAFACDEHFFSSKGYIVGWVDFAIAQRQAYAQGNSQDRSWEIANGPA